MSRSSPLLRLQVLSVSAICAAGALGTAAATAAPITATAAGHSVFQAAPTGGKIETVTSSVDPATGVWTTAVRFDAAQSASALRVSLIPLGKGIGFSWTADTDPAHFNGPQPEPDHLSTGYFGTPGVATSIAYDADRTVLTLTATDPALMGYAPDYVRLSTAERGGGTEYSTARVFLGPVAPRTTIPVKAKQLTAAKGGTIRIPLNALKTRADRRVTLRLGGQVLALKSLSAKYSSRREAIVRLSKTGIERLGNGNRTVVLQVETGLDNTSKAYARKTVKLRRR